MKKSFLILPAMITLFAFTDNIHDRLDKVSSDEHMTPPKPRVTSKQLELLGNICSSDNPNIPDDFLTYLRSHIENIPSDFNTLSMDMKKQKCRYMSLDAISLFRQDHY